MKGNSSSLKLIYYEVCSRESGNIFLNKLFCDIFPEFSLLVTQKLQNRTQFYLQVNLKMQSMCRQTHYDKAKFINFFSPPFPMLTVHSQSAAVRSLSTRRSHN